MIRRRDCAHCATAFEYTVAPGSDRLYCNSVCRKAAKSAANKTKLEVARIARMKCRTLNCGGIVTARQKDGLCEACYCFAWRTGRARDPRKKPYKLKSSVRRNGAIYRVLRVPGHPLANANGDVYHHRLVAFSSRDGICGACHWCSVALEWKSAVVDHLNENKADNSPENLVVSCNRCNRARGAMLPFFRTLNADRFGELIELMSAQVQRPALSKTG